MTTPTTSGFAAPPPSPRSRRRRPVTRVALLAAVAVGCGPPTSDAPMASARPSAGAEPATAGPTGDPVEVSGSDWEGTMQVRGGAVTLTLTGGPAMNDPTPSEREVRCAEIARADLAPPPGDEGLWRCHRGRLEADPMALAIVSGADVLWTLAPLHDGECFLGDAPRIRVVDAVPDGPQELWLRVLGCDWTGAMSDEDVLLKWRDGGMEPVASARMDCDFTGDTSDPEDVPPEDETWICGGSFLRIEGGSEAPTVTSVAVTRGVMAHGTREPDGELRFGPRRQGADGLEPLRPDDVALHRLRWDVATFRFVAE